MTGRRHIRTFSFEADELVDLSSFSEYQRPSKWRGYSFCLTAASAEKLTASLAVPVNSQGQDVELEFEEVNELRPSRIRGHSFRTCSLRSDDGQEVSILNISEDQDAKKQASRNALMSFLKDKQDHEIELSTGQNGKRELVITNNDKDYPLSTHTISLSAYQIGSILVLLEMLDELLDRNICDYAGRSRFSFDKSVQHSRER